MKSHFFAYIARMRFIQRWALLRTTVAEKMHREYLEGCVGKVYPVLFEQAKGELFSGHAPNYMEVLVQGGEELHNAVKSVRITRTDGQTLYGQIMEETV